MKRRGIVCVVCNRVNNTSRWNVFQWPMLPVTLQAEAMEQGFRAEEQLQFQERSSRNENTNIPLAVENASARSGKPADIRRRRQASVQKRTLSETKVQFTGNRSETGSTKEGHSSWAGEADRPTSITTTSTRRR